MKLVILCCVITINAQAQFKARINFSSVSTCPPFKAHFADSSYGEPDTWFWDFGNGQTSSLPKDTSTYYSPGYYTVKLRVQKGPSIDSTYKIVHVLGASAAFSYNYIDGCSVPVNFHFFVDSPNSSANYHWYFSNGNVSIDQNPTQNFNTGKYKVSLNTLSVEGCKDSVTKTIQVGNIKADFMMPETICVNESIVFTNTSDIEPISAIWTVNGTVFKSGKGNAIYRFTTTGNYNIELIEDFGNCKDKINKTVVVSEKPNVAFTTSGVLQSCNFPSTVQFKNESTSAVAYKWYFGDGDSSIENSPIHTYNVAGRFSPILIAFNSNGCSDTLKKNGMVLLGPPVINTYIGIPVSGCIPFDVQPILNISTPEPITSYNWDFGDGTTSNNINPSHSYDKYGKYNITVTVTVKNGCSTVLKVSNAVLAGEIPTANFTASKTVVCGNEPVQFIGTATGKDIYMQWNLIDTFINKLQNPQFRFKEPGYKTISLIVNNNGCIKSFTKSNYILVKPPFSAKNIIYDCANQLNVSFSDKSVLPQTWHWDFGDGTTSSLQNPQLHTYPTSGKYLITLTTTNAECMNVDSSYILITNDKPHFTFDPQSGEICPGGNIIIGISNPSFIQDYSWSLGDGTQLFDDTAVQYAYAKKGIYQPSLSVKYSNGCRDSSLSPIPVKVSAPSAGFTIDKSIICAMDTLLFTDNSYSNGEHEIITRLWDFDDTQSSIINSPPYTHSYSTAGSFNAKLTITDNNYCTDTVTHTVVVKGLPLVSAGVNSSVCLGNAIQLTPKGALTYNWKYNTDLSCINCASPNATPAESAAYYVTGTDTNGCHAQDSVYVKVIKPFTLIIAKDSLDMCSDKTVQLQAIGTDLYSWEPTNTLSNATVNNPFASPQESTTYTVTATDNNHCFVKTGTVIVQVHPNPRFTIQNPMLEVEQGSQNIIATTSSENINRWLWYPGAGLSCANCPQPVVTAKDNINYTAVAYTNYSCTDTATLNIHIICNSTKIYIPTAFTPNGDGKNDHFYIQSSSRAPLRSLIIFSRNGSRLYSKQNGFTNNAADSWDGTHNGVQMPAGVYLYMAEVICINEPVPLKGTVTLLR